ncbi:MAG: hypothetical protein AAFZ52_09660 [Bacteroidota bacterium]
MHNNYLFPLLLLSLWGTTAYAQPTVNRILDLNPGPNGSSTSNTGVAFRGEFYFPATTPDSGTEIWVSDGSAAGTRLLSDLVPGAGGSAPDDLTVVGDLLFFSATTPATGRELYVTDGTTAGTRLVRDIFPGGSDAIDDGFFHDMIAYEGILYFNARDEDSNFEPWRSDGTEVGTFQLKNISESDFFGENSSFADQFTIAGPYLYFAARNRFNDTEVWRTDGTEAGTIRVAEEGTNGFDDNPFALTAFRDSLYFGAASGFATGDLFRSGGNENDVQRVTELPNRGVGGSTNDGGPFFAVLNDRLFFAADAGTGPDLWVTDGTMAGTMVLLDTEEAGFGGYTPQNLLQVGDFVYYKDELSESGIELWRTDGTMEGTTIVRDLQEGRSNSLFLPPAFHVFQDQLFFAARGPAEDGFSSAGIELFVTDGSEEGTVLVADLNPGFSNSFPNGFATVGDSLFFFAATDGFGQEPFVLTYQQDIPPLTINNLTITGPGCQGDSTGTVSFTISGGVPPYNFTEDTVRQTGLPAGNFSLRIADARDSSLELDTVIPEPTPLSVLVTSLRGERGTELGLIGVTPSGGTPPYSFAWADTSLTSNIREDLVAGTYVLTMMDVNGCTVQDSIVVDDLTSLRPLVANRDFKVYPTVVDQEVVLETADGIRLREIYLYSAAGSLIRRIPVPGTSATIRLARTQLGGSQGLHFLRLVNEQDRRQALVPIILNRS